MSCCRASSGVSPGITSQLTKKLHDIHHIFPHVTYIVVLSSQGEIIAQDSLNGNTTHSMELLSCISSFKKTTLQFALALGYNANAAEKDSSTTPSSAATATASAAASQVIHIRGKNHLFSCYEVDKNLLAFYSDMHSVELELFDTSEADERIQPLLQEIKLLIQNVVIS